MIDAIKALVSHALENMELDDKVNAINAIREEIHKHSPFAGEPVDFVRWVRNDVVQANDYNPNSVAPPEMELLRTSIMADGYTQPIVTFAEDEKVTVVDGFHRNRVGKECADVCERVHGYLPTVRIKESQADRGDRMAATIRHNRARGSHKVEAMSDIIVELKRRFWSDEKIAKELGMEPDEVLRLQQVTGLATIFADREFSEAWEAESFSDGESIDETEV
jgi:ParB-like chromosome segregation protein Spo0J